MAGASQQANRSSAGLGQRCRAKGTAGNPAAGRSAAATAGRALPTVDFLPPDQVAVRLASYPESALSTRVMALKPPGLSLRATEIVPPKCGARRNGGGQSRAKWRTPLRARIPERRGYSVGCEGSGAEHHLLGGSESTHDELDPVRPEYCLELNPAAVRRAAQIGCRGAEAPIFAR